MRRLKVVNERVANESTQLEDEKSRKWIKMHQSSSSLQEQSEIHLYVAFDFGTMILTVKVLQNILVGMLLHAKCSKRI